MKGAQLQASWLWPWLGEGPRQVYLKILTLDPGRKDHDTVHFKRMCACVRVCMNGGGGGGVPQVLSTFVQTRSLLSLAWSAPRCLGWLDTKPEAAAFPAPGITSLPQCPAF